MLAEYEIRAVAKGIVEEAKDTAHVDQGALRRSIAYTYVKDEVIFRELFYGQWNDNSQLEKLAIKNMPFGVRWKIIYTVLGGDEYEVSRTRSGRRSQRTIKKALSNKTSTSNINALITSIKRKREKDGKKKK